MTDNRCPHGSILSFDVGIRHLAYCHVRRSPSQCWEIVEWDVIDLDRVTSVEMCASRLMGVLEARFPHPSADDAEKRFDVVLVERQPKSRSIMMVAVQMFLCAYFSLPSGCAKRVKFMSAKGKLAMKHEVPPSSSSSRTESVEPVKPVEPVKEGRRRAKSLYNRQRYMENKAYAVHTTKHYLEHVLCDFANLTLLDQYCKKDDLCDAFLQSMAFIESF